MTTSNHFTATDDGYRGVFGGSHEAWHDEILHAISSAHDRFDGFDRGDLDSDDDEPGYQVIGRMRCPQGVVEIVKTWCRLETFWFVTLNGASASEWLEDHGAAVRIGRAILRGERA